MTGPRPGLARRVIGVQHVRDGAPYVVIRIPGDTGRGYAVSVADAVADYGRRDREAAARAVLAPILAAARAERDARSS